MIEGTCHCGAVRWTLNHVPERATACNCTVCRRLGTLWAYGHEGETVTVTGPTNAYLRDPGDIGFHFCPDCGCMAYWRGCEPGADGRRRIAVNLRLAEPRFVADVPLRRFDGLGTFKGMPADGRCVADIWF